MLCDFQGEIVRDIQLLGALLESLLSRCSPPEHSPHSSCCAGETLSCMERACVSAWLTVPMEPSGQPGPGTWLVGKETFQWLQPQKCVTSTIQVFPGAAPDMEQGQLFLRCCFYSQSTENQSIMKWLTFDVSKFGVACYVAVDKWDHLFQNFGWPLFQIFSYYNPSRSFRLSGIGLESPFDKSRPRITYSARKASEHAYHLSILLKNSLIYLMCSLHHQSGPTPKSLSCFEKHLQNISQLHITWSSVLSSAWTRYKPCVTLEVISQGRPVSIVTADYGKRKAAFFCP